MLSAAYERVTTFASDIWAASSINKTSTLRRASGCTQNRLGNPLATKPWLEAPRSMIEPGPNSTKSRMSVGHGEVPRIIVRPNEAEASLIVDMDIELVVDAMEQKCLRLAQET